LVLFRNTNSVFKLFQKSDIVNKTTAWSYRAPADGIEAEPTSISIVLALTVSTVLSQDTKILTRGAHEPDSSLG
jgi:hypothetical protein